VGGGVRWHGSWVGVVGWPAAERQGGMGGGEQEQVVASMLAN
jgi:hypothetical protein